MSSTELYVNTNQLGSMNRQVNILFDCVDQLVINNEIFGVWCST